MGYLETKQGRSRIYASDQDAKPLRPMQVFEQARTKLPGAAEAWLERLLEVEMTSFKDVVANVPTEIMSHPARDFGLCLIELNRTALITKTFQYA